MKNTTRRFLCLLILLCSAPAFAGGEPTLSAAQVDAMVSRARLIPVENVIMEFTTAWAMQDDVPRAMARTAFADAGERGRFEALLRAGSPWGRRAPNFRLFAVAPDSSYAALFEKAGGERLTVTLSRKDGRWKIVGYALQKD